VEYLYNSTFVSETDPGEGHFSLGPENGSLNFNFHDYRGVDLEDWIFSSRVGLVRLESVLDPNNWLDFYVQASSKVLGFTFLQGVTAASNGSFTSEERVRVTLSPYGSDYGHKFYMETSTSTPDPEVGTFSQKMRLNNALPSLTTQIYLSNTQVPGLSFVPTSWLDPDNPVKGNLYIRNGLRPTD